MRGIFELFLGLDPRSPCLALFPYPCFPCHGLGPLLPVWHAHACESSLWSLSSCLFTCSLVPEIDFQSLPITKMASSKSLVFSQASVLDLTSSARNLMFLVSLWSFLLASPFCVLLHIIFMKSVLITFETFT